MDNKLIDTIEGLLLLVLIGAFIWSGIAIAEGVVNVLTVTVMAVAIFIIVAVVMDLNRRAE